MKITTKELKKKWIDFFTSKGHVQIKNSSLIPENDGSVLFTTAGMHPLVPYLLGQPHPQGRKLCNIQRCLRTVDFDNIGDDTHCTFFEMLGNWSMGDYFKDIAIRNSYEFLTKQLNIPKERLAVTCFKGDEVAPKDTESHDIWKSCGLEESQIFYLDKEHNWWEVGPTGPCGPDSEMFYITDKEPCGPDCSPACDCGRYVEIWNDVFMQFVVHKEGEAPEPLKQKNVDTGMGLERTVAKLNGFQSVYDIDCFRPIIDFISENSKEKYCSSEKATRYTRIIADHIRSATFLLGDEKGIVPSNIGQGYILRRLIRRSINCANYLGFESKKIIDVANLYIDFYKDDYPILVEKKELINKELEKELAKFNQTIISGLKELNKLTSKLDTNLIDGKSAFRLYDTFGFPIELTEEIAREKGFNVDRKGFEEAFKEHQEKSRTASSGTFKGGLSSSDYIDTKYHTATHLMLASLREMFGDTVFQRGSNITPERVRFDFSFDRKMTDEEKATLENKVNGYIKQGIPVVREMMTLDQARKSGAMGIFDSKYGDTVSVYTIGNVSKEICGGPHVKNTNELGRFKILKEESSSSGVRRIKAVLLDE